MTKDIEAIRKILPHRYPFLMIDRVLEVREGEYCKAVKNVTINEPFFQGHYPGTPIMPGVLVVEAMAQLGGAACQRAPGGLWLRLMTTPSEANGSGA